jgi:hypothetical protein
MCGAPFSRLRSKRGKPPLRRLIVIQQGNAAFRVGGVDPASLGIFFPFFGKTLFVKFCVFVFCYINQAFL